MKNVIDTEYFINEDAEKGTKLVISLKTIEKLTNMKDWGVIFDFELSFRNHIQLKINKA